MSLKYQSIDNVLFTRIWQDMWIRCFKPRQILNHTWGMCVLMWLMEKGCQSLQSISSYSPSYILFIQTFKHLYNLMFHVVTIHLTCQLYIPDWLYEQRVNFFLLGVQVTPNLWANRNTEKPAKFQEKRYHCENIHFMFKNTYKKIKNYSFARSCIPQYI